MSVLERVARMEAQLEEGLGIMKAQLDRLEKSSKDSSAQLLHDVNKRVLANFAQLMEHGSKMFVTHYRSGNTGKHNKKV